MGIGYAVELKYNDLTVLSVFNNSSKMLQPPARISVTGGWDQKGVVFLGIEGRSNFNLAIRYLGLHPATRESVTQVGQLLDTLRAKNIPTPGKAGWSRNPNLAQLKFDQCQLSGEPGGISGYGERGMGPTVISDLKTHLMNLCDFPPSEVVLGILRHPSMADKKCCAETQILEEWGDECPL
ncbi:MAG: hypothetical protein L0Z46_02380 [Nitrospiraceae bacterium]|nr:hypothetical protein [Nitrospiraceae bacterium]